MEEMEYECLDTEMLETETYLVEDDAETTCSVCFAEFLESEDLEAHIAQVHAEPASSLVQCSFCPSKHPDKLSYSDHLVEKHLQNVKCCKYCSRVFIDLFSLLQHEAKHIHHKDKKLYNCSNCKQVFSTIGELEKHEFEVHKDSSEGVFLFDVYSLLSSIMSMKVDSFLHAPYHSDLFCVVCKFETKSKTDYINHLSYHKDASNTCDKCSKVFKLKKSLIIHFKSHPICNLFVDKKLVKSKCKMCQTVFPSNIYKEHVKKCQPIKCKPCDQIYSSVSELTKHQLASHPLSVVLLKCLYCRREFINKETLDRHIEKLHEQSMHLYKYKCVYCQMVYKHPQKLFGHFFSTHPDFNPYTCKICNTSYRVRKAFSRHIKMKHDCKGYVVNDEKFCVFFTDEKPVKKVIEKEENQDKSVKKEDEKDNCEKTDDKNDDKTESQKKDNENLENEEAATDSEMNKSEKIKEKSMSNNEVLSGRLKAIQSDVNEIYSDDSDDEPLSYIKKRKKVPIRKLQRQVVRLHKKRKLNLTCQVCNKYCYTFQNYERHMSLHAKNERKECIKCSRVFHSAKSLRAHIEKSHSSSELTETLKNLLERRKKGEEMSKFAMRKQFLKTFKKVAPEKSKAATVRQMTDHDWSVKRYIENFMPENTEKKYSSIENNVTMNLINTEPVDKNIIQLKKFTPENIDLSNIRLTLPTKFKATPYKEVEHKVSMTLVHERETACSIHIEPQMEEKTEHYNDEPVEYQEQEYIDDDFEAETIIPDVAQEVMLENDEKVKITKQRFSCKIDIPNLPKQVEEMRIAHLLPEAPFYKIVKVKDVIRKAKKEEPSNEDMSVEVKELGTKLVHANPLAHFFKLKGAEILPPGNKYYKPKLMNYPLAIAKALLDLEKPKPPKSKKKKVEDTFDVPIVKTE